MVWILVLLFVLLNPGVLFTIPSPGRNLFKGSNYTSFKIVIVHAVIFYLIASLIKTYYNEGFLTQQQIDAAAAVTTAKANLAAANTNLATATSNLATANSNLLAANTAVSAPAPAPATTLSPPTLSPTSSSSSGVDACKDSSGNFRPNPAFTTKPKNASEVTSYCLGRYCNTEVSKSEIGEKDPATGLTPWKCGYAQRDPPKPMPGWPSPKLYAVEIGKF